MNGNFRFIGIFLSNKKFCLINNHKSVIFSAILNFIFLKTEDKCIETGIVER